MLNKKRINDLRYKVLHAHTTKRHNKKQNRNVDIGINSVLTHN